VKITPDGKTAIVSLSAGFFTVPGASLLVNASSIPSGPSKVLFIDLATKTVTTELDTGDGATGIAITHDGRLAFVCHVGTSMVSVIDLSTQTVLQQVDLGGNFAEEISLDDTDTVGIVTYLDGNTTSKNVKTFAVADMASTLSGPIPLNSDTAGVPFFPGTKVAYVVLAYNPITSPDSGYALIGATDPHAPVKLVETQWTDATYVDYQAIAAPARGTVLVPVTTGGKLTVREYGLGTGDVVLKNTFPVVPAQLFGAFGAVIDSKSRVVLTLPGDRELAVLDLGSGASFSVPWFTEAGPMGIALSESQP
jgi:DNA-binding beta-propeller fold protein YncE